MRNEEKLIQYEIREGTFVELNGWQLVCHFVAILCVFMRQWRQTVWE